MSRVKKEIVLYSLNMEHLLNMLRGSISLVKLFISRCDIVNNGTDIKIKEHFCTKGESEIEMSVPRDKTRK